MIAVVLDNDNISVPMNSFIRREIQWIGSFVGVRKDILEALELAKLYKMTCKMQKFKLDDISNICEDMKNYKISGRALISFTPK